MRGKVYFVEILIAYEVGLSKETQRATVLTTCAGLSLEDAEKKLKSKPLLIAARTLKKLGKIRNNEIIGFKLIKEMSLTNYEIN